MSIMTDAVLQAPPATKPRGYWATVSRRIARDKISMICALVLIVMVLRLARRIAFGVPPPEASMPPIEQRASLWAQYALYVLLFVTTLLGWAGTNAYGDPVSVFGLFDGVAEVFVTVVPRCPQCFCSD